MLTILFAACLVLLAALPAWLTFRNLPLFQPLAPLLESDRAPAVSVLIPARNEAAGIEEAITRVLESRGVRIELLIMDDHSADQTASLVAQRASEDSRVWLLLAPELPDGWNGKQHACWHLAQAAQFEFLLFVDADVRLATDAIARLVASLQESAVVASDRRGMMD